MVSSCVRSSSASCPSMPRSGRRRSTSSASHSGRRTGQLGQRLGLLPGPPGDRHKGPLGQGHGGGVEPGALRQLGRVGQGRSAASVPPRAGPARPGPLKGSPQLREQGLQDRRARGPERGQRRWATASTSSSATAMLCRTTAGSLWRWSMASHPNGRGSRSAHCVRTVVLAYPGGAMIAATGVPPVASRWSRSRPAARPAARSSAALSASHRPSRGPRPQVMGTQRSLRRITLMR
jgi:hypothetical protein